MGWNDRNYLKEVDGDYDSQEEIERAYANGDIDRLSNGRYYDRETGKSIGGWHQEMNPVIYCQRGTQYGLICLSYSAHIFSVN